MPVQGCTLPYLMLITQRDKRSVEQKVSTEQLSQLTVYQFYCSLHVSAFVKIHHLGIKKIHKLQPIKDSSMCSGVDSVSKNEYQDIPGGKDGRCVRVTTLPPSCAECLEILEP